MDPKHIVRLQGREYPLFAGILAEAHERGLQSIAVELLQVPEEANEHTAICRATVTMQDGSTFSDVGDASPRNTNPRIATALIRMASTRAKGRALRDAINVGQTMLEELPDLEEGSAAHAYAVAEAPQAPATGPGGAGRGNGRNAPETRAPAPPATACGACGKELTQGRAASTFKRLGKVLCLECERVPA